MLRLSFVAVKRARIEGIVKGPSVWRKPEPVAEVKMGPCLLCSSAVDLLSSTENINDDSAAAAASAPPERKCEFVKISVPWLLEFSPCTLMRRECYSLIINTILLALDRGNVLLTGSEGSGKTQMQAVLFKALVDANMPVVLDLEDGCFCFVDAKNKDRRAR